MTHTPEEYQDKTAVCRETIKIYPLFFSIKFT